MIMVVILSLVIIGFSALKGEEVDTEPLELTQRVMEIPLNSTTRTLKAEDIEVLKRRYFARIKMVQSDARK